MILSIVRFRSSTLFAVLQSQLMSLDLFCKSSCSGPVSQFLPCYLQFQALKIDSVLSMFTVAITRYYCEYNANGMSPATGNYPCVARRSALALTLERKYER